MTSSLVSVVKVSSSQTIMESEEASVGVEGRQRELGPAVTAPAGSTPVAVGTARGAPALGRAAPSSRWRQKIAAERTKISTGLSE